MEELFFRKEKKYWVCSDRAGHFTYGVTKSIAKNAYYALYGRREIISGRYDMSQLDKELPNDELQD